jgi:import inner membrane translocase subunit TIM44
MIKNNPRIQSAVEDLRKKGLSVSDAINQSLQDSAVLQAIGASYGWATSAAFRATQPIRDTPVYQAIATSFEEAFDDDTGIGSRYGGYEEKEARRKRREKRAEKAGRTATKRTAVNPE